MAKYLVEDSTLTAIVDSIRVKSGTEEKISLTDIPSIVENIKGGFPNGMEWTFSNVGSETFGDTEADGGGQFNSVDYHDGIWVTGDSLFDTGLWYSTNGKIWTQSNVNNKNILYVTYCGNLWIACGQGDGVYWSNDGKTWTISNLTDQYWNYVDYANGVYVLCSSMKGLYYSTDGKTWTQSNITSGGSQQCLYGNSLWVAGGQDCAYWSNDGKTWTTVSTGAHFYCLDYYDGIWVAGAGYYNGGGLYYSTNGKTWTQSNITSGSIFMKITHKRGLWVAAYAGNGVGSYYSTDGKTWYQPTENNAFLYDCEAENGIWIGAGWNDSGAFYSIDGINWIQSNRTNHTFFNVHYADGIWVAGTDRGLFYSVAWEAE